MAFSVFICLLVGILKIASTSSVSIGCRQHSQKICDFESLNLTEQNVEVQDIMVHGSDVSYTTLEIVKLICSPKSKNEVQFLPTNIFKTFEIKNVKITRFLVEKCDKITSLTGNEFKDGLKLEYLKIFETSLKEIHQKSFENLENLKTLNLSSNQIEFLDKNAFKYLSSLRNLNLANNKLRCLPENILMGTTKLNTIVINNNYLEFIDFHQFKYTNITKANFKDNSCISLDRNITAEELMNLTNLLPDCGRTEVCEIDEFSLLSVLKLKSVENQILAGVALMCVVLFVVIICFM
jgi:Leucine-rich repeat (LRR) protein